MGLALLNPSRRRPLPSLLPISPPPESTAGSPRGPGMVATGHPPARSTADLGGSAPSFATGCAAGTTGARVPPERGLLEGASSTLALYPPPSRRPDRGPALDNAWLDPSAADLAGPPALVASSGGSASCGPASPVVGHLADRLRH